jgi:hypothetical protein
VSSADLDRSEHIIGLIFRGTTAVVIAGNLFVALICAVSEQQAQVAQAMSIVRDSIVYDNKVEEWWRKFSSLRTNAVLVFFFSIPLFFVSLACESYIIFGKSYVGILGSLIFLVCGGYTYYCIDFMNKLFRKEVLMINDAFVAPKYSSKTRRVSSSHSFERKDD